MPSSTCSGPAGSAAPGGPSQFERRYAALDRVLPRSGPPVALDPAARPEPEEAFRALDRHRGPRARRRVGAVPAGLLPAAPRTRPGRRSPPSSESGELVPVEVGGWRRAAYLHRDARRPRARSRPGAPLALRQPHLAAGPDRARCSASTTGSRSTPRPQAGARLLRPAVPPRRPARRPGRPQGGPRGAGVLVVRRATWEPDPPPGAADELADELALWRGGSASTGVAP